MVYLLASAVVMPDVERSFLLLLLPTMILSVFPTNPELKNCVFFDEYKNAALLEDDDDEDGE